MKSKIRVEYDFDKKEPYIQMYLENTPNEDPDLRDTMLKAFINHATMSVNCDTAPSLQVIYPPTNADNSCPQIRWVEENPKVVNNPPQWAYEEALNLIDRLYSFSTRSKDLDGGSDLIGLLDTVENFRNYKRNP